MKYLLFRTDGQVDVIETDDIMPCDKMRELVGGDYEHTRHGVTLNGYRVNLDLFVNEIGWVTNPPLPANPFFPHLAGNAIGGLIKGEGDFYGVPEHLIPVDGSVIVVLERKP